jgi:hypothetical protein
MLVDADGHAAIGARDIERCYRTCSGTSASRDTKTGGRANQTQDR